MYAPQVIILNGITLNGEAIATVSNWQCACSGGHPINEPNAKCYAKGGQMVTDYVIGDRVVAIEGDYDEFEWLDQPRGIFVNGPGWVPTLADAVAVSTSVL
jgi:hypothetical protein